MSIMNREQRLVEAKARLGRCNENIVFQKIDLEKERTLLGDSLDQNNFCSAAYHGRRIQEFTAKLRMLGERKELYERMLNNSLEDMPS